MLVLISCILIPKLSALDVKTWRRLDPDPDLVSEHLGHLDHNIIPQKIRSPGERLNIRPPA